PVRGAGLIERSSDRPPLAWVDSSVPIGPSGTRAKGAQKNRRFLPCLRRSRVRARTMKTQRRVRTRKRSPWTTTEGSRPERRLDPMVDPIRAPSPGSRLPLGRGSVEYCLGTEADHEAVYQTLVHVFHGPDRDSFLGALSDPAYQPHPRLLAQVDGKVVSHIHLTERSIRYGSVTIPIHGV